MCGEAFAPKYEGKPQIWCYSVELNSNKTIIQIQNNSQSYFQKLIVGDANYTAQQMDQLLMWIHILIWLA